MVLWSILVLAFCAQISVHAASNANPLKEMPSKTSVTVGVPLGTGCDFFTPEYTSNFTMTATSSNKKVATVKVYNFEREGKYSKGYMVTRKGYGSTNIKVTVKIGKKTYTKTCKYTFYKYSNPFSSLKIGKNTYTKKMSSSTLKLAQSKLSGKISIKLKKGYKLKYIFCYYGGNYTQKQLKNNAKLPANVQSIYITIQNTKTKTNFAVCISP